MKHEASWPHSHARACFACKTSQAPGCRACEPGQARAAGDFSFHGRDSDVIRRSLDVQGYTVKTGLSSLSPVVPPTPPWTLQRRVGLRQEFLWHLPMVYRSDRRGRAVSGSTVVLGYR